MVVLKCMVKHLFVDTDTFSVLSVFVVVDIIVMDAL